MSAIELLMPQMGESIHEGTILRWLKQPGEVIEADESVLEVATDKVDTEIPSPASGVLKEILVASGSVVKVGQPIALIEVSAAASKGRSSAPKDGSSSMEKANGASSAKDTNSASAAQPPSPKVPVEEGIATKPVVGQRRFFSPLVRRIAKAEGISLETLALVPGTGLKGRLTKNDLLRYLKEGKPIQTAAGAATSVAVSLPHVAVGDDDEVIEMTRMRRMIADRMRASKHIAPHVTSFAEADVTRLVAWRNLHKHRFYEENKEALTLTPLFLEAVLKALKEYPMLNASVSGTQIIKRKRIHLGLAVALPDNNLIVPVIKNADHLALRGLIQQVNDLSRRARAGALKPEDLEGGTYTVSNLGSVGSLMGTPILMQPQVGIMALGAVKKRVVVMTDSKQGDDTIAIRQMMYLSHSYDHRIIDGALGGAFVQRVSEYLSQFDDQRAP